MPAFVTLSLPAEPTVTAPDGSDVRVLVQLPRGSMAHFELAAGRSSAAITHRTVEELWFVLGGSAEMWRAGSDGEAITRLDAGTSLSIPVGTRFQFLSLGPEPFSVVSVTMPPWPGADEALFVTGPWQAA